MDGGPPRVPWDGPGDSRRLAEELARFVLELRRTPLPATTDDPGLSWYRGGPLSAVDVEFRQAVEECRTLPGLGLDLDRALDMWADLVAAEPDRRSPRAWYHGDLLAENLLVRAGRPAAVLDFGCLAVGDPAVDQMVGWEILDGPGRRVFREALGSDAATWEAGRGWALFIAMITFPYYWRTMPARCAARRVMAAAALTEG